MVRVMTYRMYGAFIAALGAIVLMFAANETFARSAVTSAAVAHGRFASTHPISRPLLAHSLRHHRRNNAAAVWASGDYFGTPTTGEPVVDTTQSGSSEVHYTYKQDVPWDWAHRFPPSVAPSERPYIPSCPAETVTVPGQGGGERTVNIIRCY